MPNSAMTGSAAIGLVSANPAMVAAASYRPSRSRNAARNPSLDLSWLSSDGVAGLAVVSWVSDAWLVSGAVSPALRSLVVGAGGSVSGERYEALVAGGDEICPGPSLG